MQLKYIAVLFFLAFRIFLAGGQQQPNIVLIFPDNIGIGEVASYGGVRGVPTPNIDEIGANGIRLTNFNVEYTCVPSRIALLTGRYAVRTGENYFDGITLWEETLAERLKNLGYATGIFGKWDIGGPNWQGVRAPTDQGFDIWYGIPGTSHVAQFTEMPGFEYSDSEQPYVWEGKTGSPTVKVKPYNLDARRTLDREAAHRAINFMRDNASQKTPFFVYYPMTQLHFPALPHPDKSDTTGAGDMGDSMADVDYNVGLILEALKELGISENTIVVWCSDNGAEMRRPWRGNPGPWRGYYNSAMEGGIRTPAVIQWPGTFPNGRVSNELFHQTDLFPTLLAAAGGSFEPGKNRVLDGVNQLDFLKDKAGHSNRESAIFLNRFGKIMAIKWRDWKLWYDFKTEIPDPNPENQVRLFDLGTDPREEIDVKDYYPWIIGLMDSIASAYEETLIQFPRVPESANKTEPYIFNISDSGKPERVFVREDQFDLKERSPALPNPNFTGSWSTQELSTVSVINREKSQKLPALGSGWGDQISITHHNDTLQVERAYFIAREIQPLQRWTFPLNGEEMTNPITLGRSSKLPITKAKWENNRLVLTTRYDYKDRDSKWQSTEQVQTVWLEAAKGTPWEPRLVVETKRPGVMGGKEVINRTYYHKGYR
jgi:arylsulfatase